ncbi:MAG: cellulase family glycosylhydrolase [Acidobacteria bacterium]|nr:cellulase family glycosylhydrolase [Acidobacteriota bacterium]
MVESRVLESRMPRVRVAFLCCALLASGSTRAQDAASSFLRAEGIHLTLDGAPFRFAGANTYFLMYSPPEVVDAILEAAAAHQFKLLRTWGFLDIGSQDGSNSIRGKQNGVYFQYWDGSQPAYNDGDDGLKRLDYVLYRAGQTGVRLILSLVNNWADFGGMDQYVRWRGGRFHDDFFTDPVLRQWYKKWIEHLLTRVNSYSGIAYKDDPAIAAWELANEPRCGGSGVYPKSGRCTTQTLLDWATDAAGFIKSIDGNHLLISGDEGFYCVPGARDWTENCGEGVDTIALARIPGIDLLSFHLYPEAWKHDLAWSAAWIDKHFADAHALGKPALLGEYGFEDGDLRNVVYKRWTDSIFSTGGSGAMFWMLSNRSDYDGFDIVCPSAGCFVLGNFGQMMAANARLDFAPVAGENRATTVPDQAVTLDPVANDVAYNDSRLLVETMDLDPAAAGLQQTVDIWGGSLQVLPDGKVEFSLEKGFSGRTAGWYTIQDDRGRVSNPAMITLVVTPAAGAPWNLFSFETGMEGWAPGVWQAGVGRVAVAADYHSDGKQSLKITTDQGGWIGVVFNKPLDLGGRTTLRYSLRTLDSGTSQNAVLKTGPSFTWCEANYEFVPAMTEAMRTVDLTKLNCQNADLKVVREMYIYFSGGGTYYLDRVRFE